MTVRVPEKTMSLKIQVPEPEESRSEDDALTPQRLASVVCWISEESPIY